MATQILSFVRQTSRRWSWVVLSLGCLSGCASWEQTAHNTSKPRRSGGDLMARTGSRIGDLFDANSARSRNPKNLSAQQLSPNAMANQTSPAKSPGAPAAMPSKALTPAPANVELLPAPPVSPTSVTMSAPTSLSPTVPATVPAAPPTSAPALLTPVPAAQLTAATPSANTEAPANTTWCRVHVRNIGRQAASQVAVTVSSPANAMLVSKEAGTISRPVQGKLDFAPVPQVNANEEVILLVGVATSDEKSNRLRVQVRDGQGGSNQDVQARWQVTIEAE